MKKLLFLAIGALGFLQPVLVSAATTPRFAEGPQHWYLPVSALFDYLLGAGMQLETLFYFVLLSVALLIFLIFNQLVGIKLFDVYVLSIWVLMMQILGLPYFLGFIAWFVLFLSGINIIFKRITFLYFSKVVIHLLSGLFAVLLAFLIAAEFGFALYGVHVLAVVVLLFVTQHVIVKDVDRLGKSWLELFIKSLIVALLAYFIVNWATLSSFLMSYPDLLLLSIPLLLWLGRRTGLRLAEWSRFSRLIREEADEDYKDLLS